MNDSIRITYEDSMIEAVKSFKEIDSREILLGSIVIGGDVKFLPLEFRQLWKDLDYVLIESDKHIVPDSLRLDVVSSEGITSYEFYGRLVKNEA